jgi:hypothetical protein
MWPYMAPRRAVIGWAAGLRELALTLCVQWPLHPITFVGWSCGEPTICPLLLERICVQFSYKIIVCFFRWTSLRFFPSSFFSCFPPIKFQKFYDFFDLPKKITTAWRRHAYQDVHSLTKWILHFLLHKWDFRSPLQFSDPNLFLMLCTYPKHMCNST